MGIPSTVQFRSEVPDRPPHYQSSRPVRRATVIARVRAPLQAAPNPSIAPRAMAFHRSYLLPHTPKSSSESSVVGCRSRLNPILNSASARCCSSSEALAPTATVFRNELPALTTSSGQCSSHSLSAAKYLFLLSSRGLGVLVEPVHGLENPLIDCRLSRVLIPFEPAALGLRQLQHRKIPATAAAIANGAVVARVFHTRTHASSPFPLPERPSTLPIIVAQSRSHTAVGTNRARLHQPIRVDATRQQRAILSQPKVHAR